MYVLGLKTWGHDTGAAILTERDGEVVCVAVSEARLNREKTSGRFPVLSIDYCLRAMGLERLDDVDLVVVDRLNETLTPDVRLAQNKLDATLWPDEESIRLELNTNWPDSKTIFVNHVDAHAASAFFVSPFDDAAILVVEGGYGLYSATDGRLETIDRVGYDSIPYKDKVKAQERAGRTFNISKIYNMTTKGLGFGWSGAGKTMGLAAYGHTVPRIDRLDLNREHCIDPFHDQYDFIRELTPRLKEFLKIDPKEGHLSEKRINAARETQEMFVDVMLEFAARAQRKTGKTKLALAGGSALSCVANRAIIDSELFEDLFVQPASSDEGIPLGCALLGWHLGRGRKRRLRMQTAYLGQPYSTEEIEEAANLSDGTVSHPSDADIARMIADGAVIGRFFGSSEYGPRALGNRSILADPRDPSMVDRVNRTIKHREGFRPFAPSCLAEEADRYFYAGQHLPFMLVACQVREEYRNVLPAITHVDGSCRPQCVRQKDNPGYAALLRAMKVETGHGVLLNTSFNDNDEPICETPLDAVISFLKTNLDGLILEDRFIQPPQNRDKVLNRLQHLRRERIAANHDSIASALVAE